MYQVKAIISIPGQPNKLLLEGIYVQKGKEKKEIDRKILVQKCEENIRSRIKPELGIILENVIIKISYKKLPEDFFIVE